MPSKIELLGAPRALTRLFQAAAAKPEWFTAAFLSQVPVAQIDAALASVKAKFGAFRRVEGSGLDYDVHMARGSVHVRVVLDHAGTIAALMM